MFKLTTNQKVIAKFVAVRIIVPVAVTVVAVIVAQKLENKEEA